MYDVVTLSSPLQSGFDVAVSDDGFTLYLTGIAAADFGSVLEGQDALFAISAEGEGVSGVAVEDAQQVAISGDGTVAYVTARGDNDIPIAVTAVDLRLIAPITDTAISRVRDVDFAEEAAALTRSQILTQGGIAILAQANQIPEGTLGLLA